jgi:hypothetical protein
MKIKLKIWLIVVLLCSITTVAYNTPVIFDLIEDEGVKSIQLPPVYMDGTRMRPFFFVYEDDYEELTDEGKKTLAEYYAPLNIHIKKRPWSFY